MKKLIFQLALLLTGFLLWNPLEVEAHALDNFDIKTENASTVTAESIDAVLAKKAGDVWHGQGETIMDISNATGINAAFLMAKMFGESGWDTTARLREANNPGNIIHVSGDPYVDSSGRKWQKYSSMEEGLKAVGELLDKYYADGLKTLKPVLDKYAPTTDGNDHNQMMDIIQSIAESFGQDLTNGGAINTGSGQYEKAKQGGDKVGDVLEPMIEFGAVQFANPATVSKGVNTTSTFGSTFVVGFSRFSQNIYDKSKVVTAFMTVGFILYTLVNIALVVIGYNGLFESSPVIEKATQFMLGSDVNFDRRGLFKLLGRAVMNMFILAIVISGIYVLGFSAIYSLLGIL